MKYISELTEQLPVDNVYRHVLQLKQAISEPSTSQALPFFQEDKTSTNHLKLLYDTLQSDVDIRSAKTRLLNSENAFSGQSFEPLYLFVLSEHFLDSYDTTLEASFTAYREACKMTLPSHALTIKN